jgi:predicted metal-dependent phosphoesterase TrpH
VRIDLHLHSNASDGSLTPAALASAARIAKLDIIALTDHDTAAGVAGAIAAADSAPIVIPGIEISSSLDGDELHILGYFVDHEAPVLQRFTEAATQRRRERMIGMIGRLQELGVEVEYEDVIRAAGADTIILGRPHLARALVDRGAVSSTFEAFDRYLADGGPAFLPTEFVTPRDAMDLIHEVGGIAIWAHPPWEVLERVLEQLVQWGLQGLECYRPRNTASLTDRLLHAAGAYDLLITGGSDWHGVWHGPLGEFNLRRGQVEEFLQAGGL